MTTQEKLTMLKFDLQMLSSANDEYLQFLLSQAAKALEIEGVINDESAAYNGVEISYAAYLFRKRAADSAGGRDGATGMPRFLRWQINNLIISQKAGDSDDI